MGIDSNETNSIVNAVDEGPKIAKLVVKTLNGLQSNTENLFFRFILLILGASVIALAISNKKRS
jgi:hypothetical protein